MTKKKKEKQKLPEPLETQRNYVLCGPIVNTHVSIQASNGRGLLSGCFAGTSCPVRNTQPVSEDTAKDTAILPFCRYMYDYHSTTSQYTN
jgi:hypothetical protein